MHRRSVGEQSICAMAAMASTKEPAAVEFSSIADEMRTSLLEYHGCEPPGEFMVGRHGTTHYKIMHPAQGASEKVVCIAVGITVNFSRKWVGTLAEGLVEDGFSVLMYDYFGHGWSVAEDMWAQYTDEIFLYRLLDY